MVWLRSYLALLDCVSRANAVARVRGRCRGRPGGHVPRLDPGYTKKNIDSIPLQVLKLYSRWPVKQQLEVSSCKKLPRVPSDMHKTMIIRSCNRASGTIIKPMQ